MLTLCHIWCKHFLTFYCIFWFVFFVSKLHCSFEFYTVESSSLFGISLKQGGGITIFQDCSLETMGFLGFYVQSCILRRIWRGQGKSTRFPSRLGTCCSTRGGRCGVNDYRGLWGEWLTLCASQSWVHPTANKAYSLWGHGLHPRREGSYVQGWAGVWWWWSW